LPHAATVGIRRASRVRLTDAVHRSKSMSREGMLERMFTAAFRGLIYPQIWEDPAIDLEALRLTPSDHVVTIASGGCNVLNYLTADPAQITALDINRAHIALNHLKITAAQRLPDQRAFFQFFGNADSRSNVSAYVNHVRPHLDADARRYWDARGPFGRKRIEMFARNFYRHGLLGRFIGASHVVARLYGRDPRAMLRTRSLAEQRATFDEVLAPIFDKRLVRWLVEQPISLYGLGIPPSQHRALAGALPQGMASVLRARVERLACDFPLHQNYFALQAFGRSYANNPDSALPPYLEARHFAAIRDRSKRVRLHLKSVTEFLRGSPNGSVDCYILLDAQDWMTPAQLTELWTEISRTARPGARVIFRTAGDERLLPGRVPDDILARWDYDENLCRDMARRDRSSIYGGFHLYTMGAAR
jgi:S-adenosylmethionine-diacylglycerol 3-amino-3-carboxypropyl transferase